MLLKNSYKIFLIFNLVFLTASVFAQNNPFTGVVKDAQTGDPHALVDITINDSIYLGSTDIDGKFSVQQFSSQKVIQKLEIKLLNDEQNRFP